MIYSSKLSIEKRDKMKKLIRFSQKTIRKLAIIFCSYLFLQGLFTICNIRRVNELTYYVSNNFMTQIFSIVLVTIITAVVVKQKVWNFIVKYSRRIFLLMLACIIVFLLLWTQNTGFWYNGDMEKVFQYSEMFLKGDYSGWLPGGYPYMWPHQNGLILFVAALLRYFSASQIFYIYYYVNILFYFITIVFLYMSLKILFEEKGFAEVQMITVVAYLPYAYYCMLIYGNVIGFGWAMGAIYFILSYLRSQEVGRLAVSAVLLSLAIIFKQNYLIILIGLVILLVFDVINNKNKMKAALLTAGFIILILFGIRIPDIVIGNVTGIKIQGGNSKLAHVAMGLQESDKAPGWYNTYNESIFGENGYDKEKTAEASWISIKASLTIFKENPEYAWKFFHRKLASEWNNPTFECFHIQNSRVSNKELSSFIKSTINDGGKINIILIYCFDLCQSVLLFGVLLYLITAQNASINELLFAILFIGGFLFFVFWEAKCQYVLPFFFMLIPYSFIGYRNLICQGKMMISLQWVSKKPKLQIQGWNRIHSALLFLVICIALIAVSDAQWIKDCFKITSDTEAYYKYINEFNKNFTNLRY